MPKTLLIVGFVGFLVGDGTALERQGLPIDDVLLLEARRVEPRPFGRSVVVAQETVRASLRRTPTSSTRKNAFTSATPGPRRLRSATTASDAHATRFLDRSGFRDVYNLEGGLNAYSAFEDSMPRY